MSVMSVRHFTWRRRSTDKEAYETVKVTTGLRSAQREIEITVSPKGRSVQIYIDGKPIRP